MYRPGHNHGQASGSALFAGYLVIMSAPDVPETIGLPSIWLRLYLHNLVGEQVVACIGGC
jgi:hypothetical protein